VEPNDSATGTAAEIAAQVPVNNTVILNQAPTNIYTQATFQITGAYQNGEDVLAFTNDGTNMGDIVGTFNAATGTITLTSSTATGAQWQAALRAVQYYDTSDSPHTADRTVTMNIVNNGTPQALGTATVSVTAVDDSPVLDNTVAESLPHGTEDAIGAPSGTGMGFLVSTILVGNVTDPDGANAHDAVAGGTDGIAVVGADTTQGSWWYQLNGSSTWVQFASSSMTAISGSNALHLQADAKIYFQPTTANWNGTLPAALSYRAWDRSDSAADGSLSALPSGLGSGVNTAGAAYSSAIKVLPLTVDPVNDAPIATGTASLTPVTAGNPPASATVSELFTSTFNDQTDQVTGGSSANTLAGIAITGNSATPGQGTWKYSLDNGTTWVEIVPADVSLTTALILPNTAKIEFVAAGGFSGSPGALAVHLIDSSNGAVTFSASTDVSTNGGITAISADPVPLRTTINPVPNNPNPPLPTNDYLTSMSAYANSLGGYSVFTGGIASEWLMGENVFRVMEVGLPGVANVSADVFYGSVPKQNLTFEAVNLSGGALPPWLFFDVATLRFTGTPPEGSEGTIDVRVIARDFKGHEAVADVHIVVMREQTEILGLLRTSANDRPPITVPKAPTGDQAPSPGNGTPIILDNAPTTNAPPADAPPPPAGDGTGPQGNAAPIGDPLPLNGIPSGIDGQRQGSFGLSPQLREFSQAGRLARARGLLNALSAGPTAL
ncbi:MAG: putative Ig domain-containing protein, partial [Proteobacteria bacterium]|nr:putative Ig domain-containing protein [Pseudomonadota bacterium]